MKTNCKTIGAETFFIISDLDPAYHGAAQDLYYTPTDSGFAKAFPTDTPHLNRAYQNFEQSAEEMILQTARVRPSRWEQALLVFLQSIKHAQINWYLGGSSALAVRGLDITPRDLDIVVDDAGAQKLGDLMLDYLIEPVTPVQGWICNWFGRAFIYTRLEWVGGVNHKADEPEISDFGPSAASRLEVVKWHGNEIRVPPLELQLHVSERRGLIERSEKIKHYMMRTQVS